MTQPVVGALTPTEFQARLQAGENLFLLDVREPSEFEAGHAPGAVLVPLGSLPEGWSGAPSRL